MKGPAPRCGQAGGMALLAAIVVGVGLVVWAIGRWVT